MFSPKPGKNSENVAKMIKKFDIVVNKMLPKVTEDYVMDPSDYIGRGLDPDSYIGDKEGALWKVSIQIYIFHHSKHLLAFVCLQFFFPQNILGQANLLEY